MHSVQAETVTETVIQKSRFLCFLAPAGNPATAAAVLARAKTLYPDASHHCFAYVCGPEGRDYRSDDDGEPGGTAGMPILEALRKSGCTDVCAVVVRYYGGVKLGAGGLIRAYGSAVRKALAASKPVFTRRYVEAMITVPAASQGAIEHLLRSVAQIITAAYDDMATFTYRVRESDAAILGERLAHLTGYQIRPETIGIVSVYE
ncbi:MAG: YigZ family protein [bacterium]